MSMKRLLNKVCIVTGSGAGIGKAIAERFAEEGALVVCSSRRESNGRPVSEKINAAGGVSLFVQCDVSKEADVGKLFDAAMGAFGRVDVLVNNAGVNFDKPFVDTLPPDWDRVINTDLRGTYLCCRRAIIEMLKTGGGSIVNITSVHTLACLPGAAPYDAAKWGVVGMTKSLAVEFADKNIRVNTLSPGLIDTQIWDDIQNAAPDIEECHRYWKSNIPMGRVGTVEDVANAVVFLAGDESLYFCGANVVVDGGMTSQLISKAGYESGAIEGGERK
jgi:NAD(P)-dependent dehydrogenase (short-subunit alcohol dehydrogenase family)